MWNTFIYNEEVFIIKAINNSSKYTISLSNVVNIWTEELSEEDIVERCKSLNNFINTDNATFIKTVLSLIENINKNDFVLNKTNEYIVIEFKTKLSNASFKFHFDLKQSNSEQYCKEITVPVIQTIQYYEMREKQLCDLLKRKDQEIEQHIFENGPLKRKNVITDKFDHNIFDQKSKHLCCNIFSNADVKNSLVAKYGCKEQDLLSVKKEEKIIKTKICPAKHIIRSKRAKITKKM